jgi:hypothetical protein
VDEDPAACRGRDGQPEVGLETLEEFFDVYGARKAHVVGVEQLESAEAPTADAARARANRVETFDKAGRRLRRPRREKLREAFESGLRVGAHAEADAVAPECESCRPAQTVELTHSSGGRPQARQSGVFVRHELYEVLERFGRVQKRIMPLHSHARVGFWRLR